MLQDRKVLFLLILGSFFLFITQMQAVEIGSAGFAGAFLRSGIGARAIGMGGAFTGVEGDSTSIYWNPAGLTSIKRGEANFMHGNFSLDRKYNYIAVAKPISGKNYTLGIAFLQEKIDKIEHRTETGALQGYFDNTDNGYFLSGAWRISERLSVGGNLKLIDKSLFQSSASGWGVDLGVLYKATERMNFGLSVKNLGGTLEWDNTPTNPTEDIPESATLGMAYKVFDNTTVAVDIKKVRHFDTEFYAGVETILKDIVAFRLGSYDGQLTFGVGVNYKDFTFDYAYEDENLGGKIHRLATTWKFGEIADYFKKKKKTASIKKVKISEDFKVDISKGITYFENEEYGKALATFKNILKKDVNNVDALYYTGNCLVALGKKALAQKYYKKALKLDPHHKFAMYAKLYVK